MLNIRVLAVSHPDETCNGKIRWISACACVCEERCQQKVKTPILFSNTNTLCTGMPLHRSLLDQLSLQRCNYHNTNEAYGQGPLTCMGLTTTLEWTLTYIHIHNQICNNFAFFFLKQILQGPKPHVLHNQDLRAYVTHTLTYAIHV